MSISSGISWESKFLTDSWSVDKRFDLMITKLVYLISHELHFCMFETQSCSVSKETFDLTVTRGMIWFDNI